MTQSPRWEWFVGKYLILIVLWSLLVCLPLSWDIWHNYHTTRKLIIDTARANFFKDQAFRLWAARHGGVYVQVSETTHPNPYLAHLPERDIETPSGRKLTLMNPAFMLRQIMAEFPGYYGVRGRITSLKPINPGNVPDPWERAALQQFEVGSEEVMEFTEIEGEPVLRLMRPLLTQTGCLNCHARQGYRQGDVRGGVGVIVPMGEFLATEYQMMLILATSYLVVWLGGVVGIVISSRRMQGAFAALREGNELLEQKVRARTLELELANAALVRSEALLAEAQRLARLGCWELDPDNGGLHCSSELPRIFDLPVSSVIPDFEGLLEKVVLGDRDEVKRSFRQAKFIGGSWERLFTIESDNGGIKYLKGIMESLPGSAGRRIIGTVQDITVQREIELELAANIRKFRTMVDFTYDWEYWISPEGKFIYISPSCEMVSGYWPSHFMADPSLIARIIHPVDQEFYQSHISEVGHSRHDLERVHRVNFRIINRSGEVRKIEHICRAVVGEDGEYQGRRVSNRDITARARLEEQLSRLVDTLPSLLIELDPDGLISLWNHSAERILGWSGGQMLHADFLELPMQWDWNPIYGALDRTITSGETVVIPRMHYVCPDGRNLSLELTFLGFDEHSNRRVMVLGQDITEKLSMETRAFHASKLEAVGTLAAGIAHEINTPVQFIGGGVHFLKEAFERFIGLSDAVGDGPERSAEEREELEFYRVEVPASLEQIQEGVRRITSIVGAMKTFSYPSGNEPQPADINHAIATTLIIAHNEIKYVADVETGLDPALPLVPCLLNEINQVLLNLVVNAAHAIKDNLAQLPGGRGVIRISTGYNELEVMIQISDNGSGVPKEIQDRIFEPFFTTKPVGQGTGQGLAICHAVVSQHHGGSITFESQVGVGTMFTVTLPLKRKGPNRGGIG